MRTAHAVDNNGNTTKYEDNVNLDNFSKVNEDIKSELSGKQDITFDMYISANFAHEKLSHLRLMLESAFKDDMLKALDISLCMLEGVMERYKSDK